MVKLLTVLVSTISNSQVFLLKIFCYSILFSKNISIYSIFNDQSFNDTLTDDIVSFEQLGPDVLFGYLMFLISSSNFHFIRNILTEILENKHDILIGNSSNRFCVVCI